MPQHFEHLEIPKPSRTVDGLDENVISLPSHKVQKFSTQCQDLSKILPSFSFASANKRLQSEKKAVAGKLVKLDASRDVMKADKNELFRAAKQEPAQNFVKQIKSRNQLM